MVVVGDRTGHTGNQVPGHLSADLQVGQQRHPHPQPRGRRHLPPGLPGGQQASGQKLALEGQDSKGHKK